jgi:hypothetical protein
LSQNFMMPNARFWCPKISTVDFLAISLVLINPPITHFESLVKEFA